MSDLSYLIPKRNRPVWPVDMEICEIEPEQLAEVSVLGYVTAGQPVDIPQDHETVKAPYHMVRRNSYALRVRGHSMIDDNIQDGDIIIVEKRETAQNGDSVIAMINGESVTLKRFYVEAEGIRLQPANPDMQPIYLRHDELQILGIVSGVIRTPGESR